MNCKCTAPTPDGIHLCGTCAASLEQLLSELDSIVGDLVRAVPRANLTASYGERVSASGSLHAPSPINEAALDAHMALDKYLMRTALELAKVTGVRLSGRDSSGLASYLFTHMGTLRTCDWVGGVEPALRGLVGGCEKATRTATQAEFAGTCQTEGCGTELFTHQGGDTTTCRTCGADYESVQEWRDGAKAYARATDDGIVGYPDALSQRLAKVHNQTITPQHIRLLASKGVLFRVNPERSDAGKVLRPMYALGDVKALIKPQEEAA